MEEGARGKPRPGGTGGSGRAQRAALVHKGPGPQFPEPAALRTFHRTWPNARLSSWPPPPATASPFSWDPRCPALSFMHRPSSHPQPRQPRASLVSAQPCFLCPCTFPPAKQRGKGPNQKAVSENFLSDGALPRGQRDSNAPSPPTPSERAWAGAEEPNVPSARWSRA